MSACWPKNGRVPEPGFRSTHGSGVIMNMPVSVCHHVSMIGQRPLPMFLKYQRHASGLIGSPTDPSSRNDDRSRRFGQASPNRIKPRIAVGAVYRLSLIHISEPTRLGMISYAVFCLKKKKNKKHRKFFT